MSADRRFVVAHAQPNDAGQAAVAHEHDGNVDAETGSPLENLIAETINSLSAKGIALEDMEPLLHLQNAVRFIGGPDGSAAFSSRRDNKPASEALLARSAAVVDLLVQGGWTQEQAAQTMTRQLMGSGVSLPSTGGDARAWKRFMSWRTRLQHGAQPDAALEEYERFKQEIAAIPAGERLARALNDRLWDRRTKPSR